MYRAALTEHPSSRPRSRAERRIRRHARRSLRRAERALVSFTLAAAAGAFDDRAFREVQVERSRLVNEYQRALSVYVVVCEDAPA